MRWLFLLFLVLNIFYYVWHQQQAPEISGAASSSASILSRGNTIRLVEEVPGGDRSGEPVVEEMTAESCVFLGGFNKEDQSKALEQRLLSLDLPVKAVALEASAGVDYWVYLSPLASRQASLRQLRELQARHVDSYIITQGELVNGLSLGIFSREELAAALVRRLDDMGYEAQLKELPRSHRMFWVRVAPEGQRLVGAELLERLQADFGVLRSELKPCNSVALDE